MSGQRAKGGGGDTEYIVEQQVNITSSNLELQLIKRHHGNCWYRSHINWTRTLSCFSEITGLEIFRVPSASKGNTTNMAGHLRRHYKEVDLTEKTQPTLLSPFRAELPQNSTGEITSAIGVFVASDMHPYLLVTNPGFNHLISVLKLRYKMPIRSHLTTKMLPSMCDNVREKLLEVWAVQIKWP